MLKFTRRKPQLVAIMVSDACCRNKRHNNSLITLSKAISLYNDNLMVLIQSLAAIGSGTRGFQKAKMGSNES